MFVGPPFAPTSVTAKVSADTSEEAPVLGAVVVNWTEPEFDGSKNNQLTKYKINCRLVGAATWTTMHVSKDKRSATMSCLTAVGNYEIIVFALNEHGQNGSQPYMLNFHPGGKLILTTYKLTFYMLILIY